MICIGCGYICGAGRAAESGQVEAWLRSDDETGLGVCHCCGELTESWDDKLRQFEKLTSSVKSTVQDKDPTDWLIAQAKLPSLPHVLMEIYRELESDVSGVEEIVRLLETDPGLVARTLQLGNSAYYGTARHYSQVVDVVLRIGPFDLWALLMATEVKSLFFAIDARLMDMERFWRHSLFVACASRKMAEASQLGYPGDFFIAGLLHDIGKLVFLQLLPVDYEEVILCEETGELGCRIEDRVLGVNHARLGAELFAAWNLPHGLVDLIRNHHADEKIESDDRYQVLYQADLLAHHYLDKEEPDEPLSLVNDEISQSSAALYDYLCELVF